ncbi:nucleotide-binding protein [Pseudolysinimonas kribbensis]|uniref:Nucleotide-binding protein n=1 Tax=Pseudolysinimonas kribbensis TaxID=433641 RepID=A0ABQ6KG28_9MICO|nr:nucleotide-binding protein [Pseudolysinimonas kribbensis]
MRGGRLFADVQSALESLRGTASELRVVFLDATDQALVRRFEQVRRPHPLQGDGTLLDGIAAERARMADLRNQSDVVIDTSDLNVHQLAAVIAEQFSEAADQTTRIAVESFGFKYGLPSDADLVADCRFLPNPFWVPELRPLTGLDPAVEKYVLDQEGAAEFIDAYVAALAPVLAGYRRENKRHATIAIGCTGGKHRSVAIAEELGRRLRALPDVTVSVKHRDLGRE